MNGSKWFAGAVAGAVGLMMLIPYSGAQQPVQNPVGRVKIAKKQAQQAEFQPSPSTNVKAHARKRGTSWLWLDVSYETLTEWVDDLKITYYVWMETGNQREPNVILRGDATFMNIEKGVHQDAAFISPAVLKRYGKVKGVAVEFTYGGRVVAADSDPKDFNYKRAIEQLAPKDGLVLPKDKSPYALVEADGFEMAKLEAAR